VLFRSDIDADPKDDLPVRMNPSVERQHRTLDRYRADHRIHNAGELNQQSITRGLDDPSVVMDDDRVNALTAVHFQRNVCTDLIEAHEPAVPGDIGR
jgi:hypothetical protein